MTEVETAKAFEQVAPTVGELPRVFARNAENEFATAWANIKERACICLSSPAKSIRAVASMFLYAGSYAVLASCAVGTIATILPVIGIATIPAWVVVTILGGSVLVGGFTGLHYASNDRPLLPDGRTHWTDIFSMTNYWRRLTVMG